ncbi:hypothetical protein FEDK69T_11010 [Flavobacterium enshiense DK69]|uniref:DUF4270 domain-containing protein n=1 Tax=Flavobacterium enshiense DK69 TaxID=1107311 RepID=V6SBU9_9FLAO|nr:DUF4270 domain-containing protein [Flavobacterium enshiense]ESU23697.1 hypothetical protein FEDK69T_11010 [Flavobacterium enshiense DK69]KGO96172.1 hypothetical protein Q767_07930 [Flavobacterium enshiense DK69]
MNKFALAKKLLLLVSIVLFASCDKDFNTIGSDIVGQDYFDLEKDSLEVFTNNFLTGPVQTNNLSVNSLGTYVDPKFGRTTSHFVTQGELQNISSIDIKNNPVADSAWVYVPFYYDSDKASDSDGDGIRKFELDSIYGDEGTTDLAQQKFKLKVYENGYFLENYNPENTFGVNRHFSDEKNKIEASMLGADGNGNSVLQGPYLNNSSEASENEAFFFDAKERVIYKTNGAGGYLNADGDVIDDSNIDDRVVKERFPPGIWLNLNAKYFTEKILKAPKDMLSSQNAFKGYFKGLYFQVEALSGNQGALAMLDFSKGYIRVNYKMDSSNTDNDNNPATPIPRVRRFIQIKLGGNSVNFFDTNHALPTNSNRIGLKGGAGSVAHFDLFDLSRVDDNGVPTDLRELREEVAAKNWMINEANLVFYVDKAEMVNSKFVEPNRIYVYDAKNKRPVVDYFTDGSTNSSNPKLSKMGFGGIIEKDAAGHGVKYKIRITDHMKNLIFKDSTNYTLGVSVTENINVSTNAYRKPAPGEQANEIVPLGSVLSPLGTILYKGNIPQPAPNTPGNSPEAMDYKRRLKLEIYYTKPKLD